MSQFRLMKTSITCQMCYTQVGSDTNIELLKLCSNSQRKRYPNREGVIRENRTYTVILTSKLYTNPNPSFDNMQKIHTYNDTRNLYYLKKRPRKVHTSATM